jgi:AraC-like DNA-binding protein
MAVDGRKLLGLSSKHRHKCSLISLPLKTIPLPINILGYGYERQTSHDYFWDGMKRGSSPFAIWQYTLSGKGAVVLEGKEYDVLPGMAMMLEIPQKHQYRLPEETGHWEFLWVNLVGPEVLPIWRVLTNRTGPSAQLPKYSDAVNTAVMIIKMKDRDTLLNPYENSSIAHRILMQLVQELLPGSVKDGKPDFIQNVTTFCLKNIESSLTIDDLAAEAGYSKFHFNRVFKEYQGTTPMAFLTQLRMNHALRLLQSTRLNVKEISGKCGYEDPSYFCKVFRKHYKISPNRFRIQD